VSYDEDADAELEVEEIDLEEAQRLIAEGRVVQVVGPNGEALLIDAVEFAQDVRADLAENAENAPYLTGVGSLMLDLEQYDLARNAAELALAVAPGDPDALLVLGLAFAHLGRHDEALVRFDEHVAAEPNSALGHSHRSHALMALGREGEGHAAARRALGLDPDDVGAIQVLVAGPDGAAAALDRTRELAREIAGWAILRVAGDLCMTLGDETSAIAYWKEAMARGADDATIGNLLATLGKAERIDEVIDIADSLTRLSERDPGLRWNVASGYLAAGRPEEARIVFASIAHDPEAPPDVRAAALAAIKEQ
jgi:tetratricopeptide (TPR) repeat protein